MPRNPRPEIDTRWQEFAACITAPPDLFYPDLPTGDLWLTPPVRAYVREVTAAYCIGCPVRLACLTHALTFPETEGIWAGSTPPERQAAPNPAALLHLFDIQEIPPLQEEKQPA